MRSSSAALRQNVLDAAGKPRPDRDGTFGTRTTFLSNGLPSERESLGEDGKPHVAPSGVAKEVFAYNAGGDFASAISKDSNGTPVIGRATVAGVAFERDRYGNPQRFTFIGADATEDGADRPVLGRNRYAGLRLKYNALGPVIETARLDLSGTPRPLPPAGHAIERRSYDPRGLLAERTLCNERGQPMLSALSYASVRYAYDEGGREVSREFRDLEGRAVATKRTVLRVAPASNAARLGIREGDQILAYDGANTTTEDDFRNRLELPNGERPREIRIVREGRVLAIDLPAGRLKGLELMDAAFKEASAR